MGPAMPEVVVRIADRSPRIMRKKRRLSPVYDKRSRSGRRVSELTHLYKSRLGAGPSADPLVMNAISRAAELTAYAEQLRHRAVRGEPVPPDDVVRADRLSAQALRSLRLDQGSKPVEPDLQSYLRK